MMVGLYELARVIAPRMTTPGTVLPCEACASAHCRTPSVARTARRWFEVADRTLRQRVFSQRTEHMPLGGAQLVAANAIAVAAEDFVIAHEISHHVAPDLAANLSLAAQSSVHTARAREVLRSWTTEVTADLHALMLVLSAAATDSEDSDTGYHRPGPLQMAILGIEHFLISAELYERLHGSVGASSTHPPIALRRSALASRLDQFENLSQIADVATYHRALHETLWRTLATPDEHALECWSTEFGDVHASVATSLGELAAACAEGAQNTPSDVFEDFTYLRWTNSKLFVDVAAREHLKTAVTPAVRRMLQPYVDELCDTSADIVDAFDLRAPFFGAPGIDFDSPFPGRPSSK